LEVIVDDPRVERGVERKTPSKGLGRREHRHGAPFRLRGEGWSEILPNSVWRFVFVPTEPWGGGLGDAVGGP